MNRRRSTGAGSKRSDMLRACAGPTIALGIFGGYLLSSARIKRSSAQGLLIVACAFGGGLAGAAGLASCTEPARHFTGSRGHGDRAYRAEASAGEGRLPNSTGSRDSKGWLSGVVRSTRETPRFWTGWRSRESARAWPGRRCWETTAPSTLGAR